MKKRILTTFLAILCCLMYSPITSAQTIEDKTWMNVYLGHQEVKVDGYSEMGKFNIPKDMGAGIGIQRYLNPSFNVDFSTYYGRVDNEFSGSFSKYMINTNLTAQYKFANGYILEEESTIRPFLLAGVGYSWFEKGTTPNTSPATSGVQIPFGAGFDIPLSDNIILNWKSTYNRTFNDGIDGFEFDDRDHDDVLVHTLGLKFRLGKVTDSDNDGIRDSKDECPQEMGTVATNGCPDRDGDTIIDKEDRCINQPGLAKFGGCPDTDADGVPNYEDRCPEIAGTAEFQGCPDTDSDGIGDYLDECKNTPGTAATNGCPDDDNDGIKNSEDLCPNKAGTKANNGCPNVSDEIETEVNLIFNNIYFATDESTIHESSIDPLNKLASLMNDDKDLKLHIAGHADSRDTKEYNMQLSEERANAVKSYLVEQGISSSRITTEGYGETKPIASNTSADGKTRNRRVELKLSYN